MRRTIDLGMHVQDIVGVIRCEELSDVVLCGHSMAEWSSPAREQIAAKIRSLVYLDAFVPETASRYSITGGRTNIGHRPIQSGRMKSGWVISGRRFRMENA
jgi:hypothetical protein